MILGTSSWIPCCLFRRSPLLVTRVVRVTKGPEYNGAPTAPRFYVASRSPRSRVHFSGNQQHRAIYTRAVKQDCRKMNLDLRAYMSVHIELRPLRLLGKCGRGFGPGASSLAQQVYGCTRVGMIILPARHLSCHMWVIELSIQPIEVPLSHARLGLEARREDRCGKYSVVLGILSLVVRIRDLHDVD
ncbi:hypothetical protein PYCCODRAFT_239043 [Trametes coccinea BRFM310]|uniref:Uncharacterized protein n=1 Tax=Trametes coccinea (strain BRFM310) TaxID=1353009 RepID=A0A1Y2ISF9_TRAC3|nr:hypothetical protein PYCCODRAFT_239043 [Trametes coccinea BRFM310]